jgi:hypothetical protein
MAADLGISLFASTGILLVLAFITTVLRCIARIYVVKAFALDDWLMVLSLVILFHCFLSCLLTDESLGNFCSLFRLGILRKEHR